MLNEYAIHQLDKDHVCTPYFIVDQIFNLINISSYDKVWFPFDNYDSQFKIKADEMLLNYKATHIYDGFNSNFFTTEPPSNCDLLISNPPFSIQFHILKRCFELIDDKKIKSFALLLPLSTLETEKRANLYEKYSDKLSIIIFKNRIRFVGKHQPFNTACCWVCYNIKGLKPIMWL